MGSKKRLGDYLKDRQKRVKEDIEAAKRLGDEFAADVEVPLAALQGHQDLWRQAIEKAATGVPPTISSAEMMQSVLRYGLEENNMHGTPTTIEVEVSPQIRNECLMQLRPDEPEYFDYWIKEIQRSGVLEESPTPEDYVRGTYIPRKLQTLRRKGDSVFSAADAQGRHLILGRTSQNRFTVLKVYTLDQKQTYLNFLKWVDWLYGTKLKSEAAEQKKEAAKAEGRAEAQGQAETFMHKIHQ